MITNQPALIENRASMYLFTTPHPVRFYPPGPWSIAATPGPEVPMFPLYRLSFDSPWPAEVAFNQFAEICPGRGRDFAYATSDEMLSAFLGWDLCAYAPVSTLPGADVANFQGYRFDQTEGYMLRACPEGWQCNGSLQEGGLQAVYLRGRPHAQNEPQYGQDWVLLLQEQLSQSQWAQYTVLPPFKGALPLGYVFKNLNRDGDLLIDGIELMIGTNPLNSDTDGDGLMDSDEYHPAEARYCPGASGLQAAASFYGNNPRVFGTCEVVIEKLFRNGFEG